MNKIQKRQTQGFTLIELIIAITIIAVLSAALIIGIDPIERFNQAADTNTRDAMVNVQKGIVSYYINNGKYPGATTLNMAITGSGNAVAAYAQTGTTPADYITDMVGLNDLPKNFVATVGSAKLLGISVFKVTDGAGGFYILTCAKPVSHKFLNSGGLLNVAAGTITTGMSTSATAPAPGTGTNPNTNCSLPTSGANRASTVNCIYCAQ